MLIDEQQYVLITYSDIPGVYPRGYAEKIYFKGRPVKIQPHEEIFLTEDKCKLTYDSHWQNHIVQALIYDKYELKLIARENYAVEVLKYAASIQIFSFIEKKVYTPVIEEITKTAISGSTFQEVAIVFWDKNQDNYYNGYPVINHLRSDHLINRGYTAATLTKVSLVPLNHDTWSTQYDYYSPFYMVAKNKRENKQDHDLNGRLYNSRLTAKGLKEITLYLSEADQYVFMQYSALCNSYNGRIDVKELGGSAPIMLELPDVESEQVKGAVDLWKVKITFTYQLINNLTFST